MRASIVFTLAVWVSMNIFTQNVRADEIVLLPESHHLQYLTSGLFIDNQTSILYRDGGKAWGAIAASFALLGTEGAPSTSQLVVTASVNTAFRLDSGLSPETADARFDLAWDTFLGRDWLMSAGYRHESGHINDSVLPQDQGLIALDLGLDSFFGRFIYSGNTFFRPGFTVETLISEGDPRSKALQANAFAEFFPWGHLPGSRAATPFLALGIEEYGHNVEQTSFHAQLGAYFGNHREPKQSSALRAVVGFYSGQDPRLKYYYFEDRHSTFVYSGLMFDL
jgi:hypothetical protein